MVQNKKVLIISMQNEKSTDEVLRYLLHFKVPFIRINDEDLANKVEIKIGKDDILKFSFDNGNLDLKEIGATWYRRGKLRLESANINVKLDAIGINYYQQYFNYYREELNYVYDYIYERLKGIIHINSFLDNKISKLNQLFVAKKNGLAIPETLVTNSLQEISKVTEKEDQILKAIDFSIFTIKTKKQNLRYQSATSILLKLDQLPELQKKYRLQKALVSLFQGYVEKKIEIRTFYLFGRLYSMAIFSQQNEKTKIDFRNYDFDNPNRNVPFQLPEHMEIKIRNFMNEMKLNSGSLDIIYSTQNEYVFLEVNPIGQFDWLSKACNYFIERDIAKALRNGLE